MPDWRTFLVLAKHHLSATVKTSQSEWVEPSDDCRLRTWCAWTTFSRLADTAGYWTEELPEESELNDKGTNDGGTWGQPFPYDDLAHVIVPRRFFEEGMPFDRYTNWFHVQDVDGLSALLDANGIEHRLGDYALEIKLY